MEMLHVMPKYPGGVTKADFIKRSTFPLELRAGIRVNSDAMTEDGAYVISAVEAFCRLLDIYEYRLKNQNKLIILDALKLSKTSVDKITQFGLIPSELSQLSNKLGYYYRWFVIPSKVKIG